MAEITKKSIEHLAELARLEFNDAEKEKFLADLNNILNHFKELESLDTSKIAPMTGGTNLRNILRADEALPETFGDQKDIVAGFPEEERGYNKIPPVF
jgi:aspartyl-tRNA(Asn)/glutamyl-tRNA(Gln) amidotransferase subunit C